MEAIKAMKDVFRFNHYVLKPYLINDGKKHHFAIICPGGAYNMICSRKEGEPYARELNKRGYHAFVLYYGIKKKARYPRPQEDLKRAINEIFANAEKWNLLTDNYSIWGSSAGGHLAASYCLEDFGTPLPNALVLCYPVITLGEHTHKKTHDNLLGKKPTIEMVDNMSIEKHISSSFPPTYAWHGMKDVTVDPINSRLLNDALEHAGVAHKVEEFEGVIHGVGLAKGTIAECWFNNALAFWKSNVKK